MRKIQDDFQARLDAEATTFCHCWRAIRRDGEVACFTDHDDELTFGGLVYRPLDGLQRMSHEAQLGLAIGGTEISGALSFTGIDEIALANGLWDGAQVETWLVDWRASEHRLLLDLSTIGEVRRSEYAFTAELRSLAHRLDQESGRRFQRSCSADLGDEWCGVSLATSPLRMRLSVLGALSASHLVFSPADVASGWFDGGRLIVLSGENAGAQAQIKTHRAESGGTHIEIWLPLAGRFAPADEAHLIAGCDKSFSTCRTKFANATRFRGFPHIPGNDVLMAGPSGDVAMDGGSLFR